MLDGDVASDVDERTLAVLADPAVGPALGPLEGAGGTVTIRHGLVTLANEQRVLAAQPVVFASLDDPGVTERAVHRFATALRLSVQVGW
jgi:hypothetical protein